MDLAAQADGGSAYIDRVLRKVIRRGFPELARKGFVTAVGDYDAWMYYEPAGPGSFLIGVDHSLVQASRRVVEGGLAHELAHILRDSRMRGWRLERAFWRYRTCVAYRTRDERETDREVIARGYGPQLIQLMQYGRARGHVWRRDEGLSLVEVRRLVAAARASSAADRIGTCTAASS